MTGALLDLVRRWIKVPIESVTGPIRHRLRHRRRKASIPSVVEALDHLADRLVDPPPPPAESPIFLLSAGWRSGSTLLQRLVMSGGGVMVWGEPYAHCHYPLQLAESLRIFTPDWPPDLFFLRHRRRAAKGRLEGQWIANLYPDVSWLVGAHREFFLSLYSRPARAEGFGRWGFKTVRLDTRYAVYLKFLFPDARFVFLVRNPYHSYRSYRSFRNWYYHWPDDPVFTPRRFGRVWRELATSFLRDVEGIGARLVRYEDLCAGGRSLEELSTHLGVEIREDVLRDRVQGPYRSSQDPVPGPEMRALRRALGPVPREFGYEAG
ncbi:MAG: sulfotransferase [Gemmatimonadota bacterium]